jgi:hypothetical protein
MRLEGFDTRWPALSEEVMTGMSDWQVVCQVLCDFDGQARP